ncbi:MAG TPA: PAS domain S-box protein [Gemmatimonadales bacterium]|nr:PAS domain S-box protein [Gemmatimonadales bacterium]
MAALVRPAAMGLLIGAAYFLSAEIGIALTMRPTPVSTLWPPNAVVMAILLLVPPRLWWAVLLAALPAHIAVELRAGIPLPMVLSWFVSNSIDALIGAGLVRGLSPGPVRFDSFRRYGVLVLATFVSVGLTSFLDAWFVHLNAFGSVGYWDNWRMRFFSNVLATLTLVPVIVGLGTSAFNPARTTRAGRLLEGALLAAILLVVCYAVFSRPVGPTTVPALLYAPLPLLLWAAVRFGPATTSGFLLGVALLAIGGAIGGDGPFVASTPAENAFSMQLFLIVIGVPLTALSAVTLERLRAEDEAVRSRKSLQLALDAAQMGTWEWQIAPDRSLWSDQSKEIFGLDSVPQDFTLDRFLQLVSPEDRLQVAAAVRRAMQEGTPYEAEFRVPRPDGKVRWVLAKGVALFDGAGRPIRLLGVNIDVTERRMGHAALSEWKSRYEAAVLSSNQVLYDWDPHTNDVTYGGDTRRILGYGREELHDGLNGWSQKIHPDDRAAFDGEIARVLATEDMFSLTYRFYHRDGRMLWLEDRGHFFRDGEGRILRMVGFVQDITERMRTDHALRSSEERFSTAFRTSPDAIAIVGRDDDRILEVNDTWENLFGYARAKVFGRTMADLGLHVRPEERARLRALLAEGQLVRDFESEVRTRAGAVRQVAVSGDTVEMGGAACFIFFIRDVTERKRAEAEAQEQRLEVAHLSRVTMLGELSGALAHELNQPLTAILANARAAQRLLRVTSPDLTELGEILEDIAADDRRAGEVIERLRAFLRKGDMQPGHLNLNDVVTDVLGLVHSDLIQRGVTVEPRLDTALPPVFADRIQLQQVLLNLLLNACDAMAGDSSTEKRVTIVTAATPAGEVELSVADQGTGIKPDQMERVFEPFVTSKPHGLGLGLSICRSIVTAHGGKLWADNNEGGGATFHLMLPEESEPAGEVAAGVQLL